MTRAGLRPIARQTRAYFAPVDRVNGPTAIFDPSQNSGFQLDAPPAPWIDLGWIENFQRTSTSQIEGTDRRHGGRGVGASVGTLWERGRFRISRLGKVADGAGGRRRAHECAGHGSERIAGRVRRDSAGGCALAGWVNR